MATLEAIDSLVIDETVYPREHVDGTHITALMDALRVGATLPPIVVAKGSRRIVDGVHRWWAHHDLHGRDAKVAVEWRAYDDDAAFLLDALRSNAKHGRRLETADYLRAVAQAERLQIMPGLLAKALSIPVGRLANLTTPPVATLLAPPPVPLGEPEPKPSTAQERRPSAVSDGTLATYRAVSHLAGRLERGGVDWQDRRLVESLSRLQALLTAALLTHGEQVA